MSDLIEDLNATAPEAVTSEKFRSSELAKAMLRLNPRQQRVLTERFGLEDGKPKTLEEVGVLQHSHLESGAEYHKTEEAQHVHLTCSRCGRTTPRR